MSFGHFIPLGILSYLDKMSFGHFVHGHFVICGHFVTLGISSYNHLFTLLHVVVEYIQSSQGALAFMHLLTTITCTNVHYNLHQKDVICARPALVVTRLGGALTE